MNTSSQGQEAQAYLQRIKKQAKRLLKFAKEHGNTIEIHNLSQAQELLAKMNGYPDWHSLEKNLDKTQVDTNTDSDNIINQIEQYEKIIVKENYINFDCEKTIPSVGNNYRYHRKDSYNYYKDTNTNSYWSAFEITDFNAISDDDSLLYLLHILMEQKNTKSGKNKAGMTSVIMEYAPDEKQTYADINHLIKELIGQNFLDYKTPSFKITFVFQSCFSSKIEETIILDEHVKHLDSVYDYMSSWLGQNSIKWKKGFSQKQWDIINQNKKEYQIKTLPETRHSYVKHQVLQKLFPFISWKEPQATMNLARWIDVIHNLIFNDDKNNWTINITSDDYQIYGNTALDNDSYRRTLANMMKHIESALYKNKLKAAPLDLLELEKDSYDSLQRLLNWLKEQSPLPAINANGSLLFSPYNQPVFYHSQNYKRTTHINVIQSKNDKVLDQFGAYLQIGEILSHYDMAIKKGLTLADEVLPYHVKIGGEEIKNFKFILEQSLDKQYHQHIVFNEIKDNLRWNIFHLPLGAIHQSPLNEGYQQYFLEKIVYGYMEANHKNNPLPRHVNSQIIARYIHEMYQLNREQPKMYQINQLPAIDYYFKSHTDTKIPDITMMSWWEITQYLIEWDEDELACQSQLMAEPNLNDYIEVLYRNSYQFNVDENPVFIFIKALEEFIKNYPNLAGEGWDNPDLLNRRINLFYMPERKDADKTNLYQTLLYVIIHGQWCNYWTEYNFISPKSYEKIKKMTAWTHYKHIFINNIDASVEDELLILLCRESRKCNIGMTMGSKTSINNNISSFTTANWIFNADFIIPEYMQVNPSWKSWCAEDSVWRCVLILSLSEGRYAKKLGFPHSTKMDWLMNPEYASVWEKLIKHHTLPEVLQLMAKHAVKTSKETIEFKDIPTQWDDYISNYPI